MAKSARPYLGAFLLGALLFPTGSLVAPASARPSVAFLVAAENENLASRVFRALVVPGPALLSLRPARRAAVPAAVRLAVVPALPKPVAWKPASGRSAGTPVGHVVASGDTLWSVARHYGTTVAALARANNMTETALIHPGQRLVLAGISSAAGPASSAVAPKPAARVAAVRRVPAQQARTIVVGNGQTLSEIADAYGVSTRALVQANSLPSAHRIRAGQRLTIPGTAPTAAQTAPRRAPVPPVRVQIPRVTQPLAASLQRGFFRWPARGVITSRFGVRWHRHHNGVDIAAPRGTPIYAGRSGVVIYAGWYFGYGRAVILNHGGGVVSIYGHASALLVRTGQRVAVGHQIARVGCTGSCTGNHVHFEVRINGRPVNPLRYL